MLNFFIFLVQFWMSCHLNLMTRTKASKQFLGNLSLTLHPLVENSAVLKAALLLKEDTGYKITCRCCAKWPSTLHNPCSKFKMETYSDCLHLFPSHPFKSRTARPDTNLSISMSPWHTYFTLDLDVGVNSSSSNIVIKLQYIYIYVDWFFAGDHRIS